MSLLPFGAAQFPVFGKNPQREMIYQNQINILEQFISEIVTHVDGIEADITALQSEIVTIVNTLNNLNTNAITSFDVQSTYDSLAIGCSSITPIDIFDAPVITPLNPGNSVVYKARPLTSTDSTVAINYNPTCGFVNLQTGISSASLTSVGSGQSLVVDGTWPNFGVRSILSSDNSVSVTYNGANEINLRSATVGVTLGSSGSGLSLVTPTGGVGPSLGVKSLIGGTGLSITPGANDNTISGNTTLLNSLGSGSSIVHFGVGPTLSMKTLTSSGSIALSQQTDTITIDATVPSLTSLGGSISLVDDGTGPNYSILGLTAGSGITLTPSATDVDIYSDVVNLLSPGTGSSLVSNSVGPLLSTNSISSGSAGLTFTQTANDIKLDVPQTILSSAGGVSLVSAGSGPSMALLGLSAGTGISLTSSPTNIVIANSASLSSAGTGASVITSSVGPAYSIRSILGGGGLTVTSNTAAVTLSSTVTSLASAGGTAATLVSSGTGPSLSAKGLTAGTGITLTPSGSDVIVSTITSSLTSVSTAESLVSSSVGPVFSTKGLTAGSGFAISTTTTAATLSPAAGSSLGTTGSGTSLVATGTVPTFDVRSILSGGPGLGITVFSQHIRLVNSTTLTSLGGDVSMLISGTGPTMSLKSFTTITNGIGLSQSSGTITISATTTTLASIGTGTSFVSDGTGPSLVIKGLTAGNDITLTPSGTNCAISSSVNLTSSGGANTMVNSGTPPQFLMRGLGQGTGILLSDYNSSMKISNGMQYLPAYGELVMSAVPTAPYVLGLTPTLTVVTPGTTAGPTLFSFTRLSDGVLQYTELLKRFVFIRATIDLQPTDATNYFIFQLRQNGVTVLDTANTFLSGSYESVKLQAVVFLATNDTVSIYARHSGAVGTINTNIVYYKLICEHHQFSAPLASPATGRFSRSSALIIDNNKVSIVPWNTYPLVHPNITNLYAFATEFLIVNTAATFSIKFFGTINSGWITETINYRVNGVIVYSFTFTTPAQVLAGTTTSLALNANDIVSFTLTQVSAANNIQITPTVEFTS